MELTFKSRVHPELRELVVEASLALAALDADRLEELAVSCQALQRDLPLLDDAKREDLNRQGCAASPEMAIFGRVIDATRANLEVMRRVRDRRTLRLEYQHPFLSGTGAWEKANNGHH